MTDGLDLPEAIHSRTDNPWGPAVYAIELDKPDSYDDLAWAWSSRHKTWPDWLDAAWEAERVVYVGATANISQRLEEHNRGEPRQAVLLSVMPPDSVVEIWPMDSADEAFLEESSLAIEFDNDHPETFVRQA